MAKTKSPVPTALKQIIHERSETGQHRLVIIKAGVPVKSPWIEARNYGAFEGYNCQIANDHFPPVFRVSPVDHEVL